MIESLRALIRYADRTTMRTDYAGHDLAYQARRAAGAIGWATADDYAEHFADLSKMLERPECPRMGRVLELGCGAGNVSLWLAHRGFEVHGVDISPTAIAWAQERAADERVSVVFRTGNVLDLAEYADGELDIVVDGHLLHCIIGADRALVLAGARRVLRSRGILCIRTMCGDPACDATRTGFDPETRCTVRDGIATRYLGLPAAITAEVVGAGFEILCADVAPNADQPMLLLVARRS